MLEACFKPLRMESLFIDFQYSFSTGRRTDVFIVSQEVCLVLRKERNMLFPSLNKQANKERCADKYLQAWRILDQAIATEEREVHQRKSLVTCDTIPI